MPRFWMVRAGEGGYLAEDFERTGHIAIGWKGAGDFTGIRSADQMRDRVRASYPDARPGALAISASMAWKFRSLMQPGDRVITYNPRIRQYLLGTITGDYLYAPGTVPDYDHVRAVRWEGRVGRDSLSLTSRNALGSTLTLFQPAAEVVQEIDQILSSGVPVTTDSQDEQEPTEDWHEFRRDMAGKAHEFIKDRLLALTPSDMEELTAALLRGMGYKARVTPAGPDRGRDVIASPDGLGFQSPRIVAEVKHRRAAMGSQDIRSFLGGLRSADGGMYVSTGGFTREARYEAERAPVPVTLVDLDDLASLVVEHYDRFDAEGRALLPLTRIYWPAS